MNPMPTRTPVHGQSLRTVLRVVLALLVTFICTHDFVSADSYPARQEQVPDFGALVPQHEVRTDCPWPVNLERITTAVPWGRGMAIVDDELIILSRGRHRGEGGVDPAIDDHAGTLWRVDRSISEPVIPGQWAGDAVRRNAAVFAQPTSPPFYLYDRTTSPEDDILMARPYCALAYDAASRNLFICAYSGAELPSFRKHATDAVYRYDLRDSAWHVVEQHDPNVVPRAALGTVISNAYYPHHDPEKNPPPHGWLNGADGCTAAGNFLYVPAKDNHLVVQYDLASIRTDPHAGPPPSRPVLDSSMIISYPGGEREMDVLGPSGVAVHGDFLYIAYRTSSIVVRVRLDDAGDIVREADGRVKGQLIAVFEPWNAQTKRSGNLYDIDMDADGDLYVSMGREGRIWRITPDPAQPFYGNDQTDRPTTTPPFLDMTHLVGRTSGSNNIFVDRDGGYLYISNRNNDTGEGKIHGTIYRVKITDPA
jgi:hypothetical protein